MTNAPSVSWFFHPFFSIIPLPPKVSESVFYVLSFLVLCAAAKGPPSGETSVSCSPSSPQPPVVYSAISYFKRRHSSAPQKCISWTCTLVSSHLVYLAFCQASFTLPFDPTLDPARSPNVSCWKLVRWLWVCWNQGWTLRALHKRQHVNTSGQWRLYSLHCIYSSISGNQEWSAPVGGAKMAKSVVTSLVRDKVVWLAEIE